MSTWERRSNNTKWLTNVCFASCLHDSIKSLGGVAKGHVVGEVELLLLLVRHGENELESRLLPGDVRLVRRYLDRFKSYLNQKLTLHLRISLEYNQCAIASVDHCWQCPCELFCIWCRDVELWPCFGGKSGLWTNEDVVLTWLKKMFLSTDLVGATHSDSPISYQQK